MATSFSGGRSCDTRREPPTMGKQLVNFITCGLRVECTLFCNLESRAGTHAILVIGLYELLDNPTTYLIEPPEPLYEYMNSLRNDVCNLFVNMHVRIKIYCEFYHCIIYIANEGCHVIIIFFYSKLHTNIYF
jgi:hypothetical protein